MKAEPVTWSEVTNWVINTAEELVKARHLELRDARIGFMFRSKRQKSANIQVLGKAQKVPERLQVYLPFDFLIWLAEDAFEDMDAKQRCALIDHELTHCTSRMGKWAMRHHDVEEFMSIIQEYGLWNNSLLSLSANVLSATQNEFAWMKDLDVTISRGRIESVKKEQMPAVDHEKEVGDLLDNLDLFKDSEDNDQAEEE